MWKEEYMPVTEKRVSGLERALEDFITSVKESHMRTEAWIREMNIKWGEMAKKLGTITEDLVAPSIPRIVKEEFGLEVTDLMVRRKKKLPDGRSKEYDAIAVADECVFVDETKSTLDSEDVKDFIKDIQEFRDYFPEYEKNKIIGVLASLYVDENVIKYAERSGFLVLAVGDKLMEVMNTKGFKRKKW